MKKIIYILIVTLILFIAYNAFLYLFPLKWKGFHSNNDRTETFIYSKQYYPVVIIGSSLNLAFDGKDLFKEPWFNLCTIGASSSTGIEIIKKTKKIPQKLFIEINRMNQTLDTALLEDMFNEPMYHLRYYFPALLKRNKLLSGFIDRSKKDAPFNKLEDHPLPPALFNLSLNERKQWCAVLPDSSRWWNQWEGLKSSLQYFTANGCQIYFFEMPYDSSLTNSRLLRFERQCFMNLAAENGYHFIKTDTSRAYQTSDGIHLTQQEADVYARYFRKEVEAIDKK